MAVPGPGKLYLHAFDWSADGKLEVEDLQLRRTEAGVRVDLPATAPDPIDTVVVLEE